MAEKKSTAAVQTSFRLPQSLSNAFDHETWKRRLEKSAIIRGLLRLWLESGCPDISKALGDRLQIGATDKTDPPENATLIEIKSPVGSGKLSEDEGHFLSLYRKVKALELDDDTGVLAMILKALEWRINAANEQVRFDVTTQSGGPPGTPTSPTTGKHIGRTLGPSGGKKRRPTG